MRTPPRALALALLHPWLCAAETSVSAALDEDVSLFHGRNLNRRNLYLNQNLEREDAAGGGAEEWTFKVDAEMTTLVNRILLRRGQGLPGRHEMMQMGIRKVDPKAAARRIMGRAPKEVASLLGIGAAGAASQPFDEASLQKARKYLNAMMESAWKELDEKVIECKEFEDRNRGAFEQVQTDIARLGEQIADLQRVISETVEFINVNDMEISNTQASLKNAKVEYLRVYYDNKREMTIRKNDLAVFEFMMKLTKCKAAAAFVQLDSRPVARVNVCDTPGGPAFHFADPKSQELVDRMMTPSARRAVREVLGQVSLLQAQEAASALRSAAKLRRGDDDGGSSEESEAQVGELSALGVATERDRATTTTTTTTLGMPTPPLPKARVQKRVDVTAGGMKCPMTPPDCGLLHDSMSLMWGKFKDLVDELQAEMDKNKYEFDMLVASYNQQLEILRNSKARYTMALNEATATLNADREEMAEHEEEFEKLEHQYKVFMKKCKSRIEWIFFQDFCSYLVVRTQLMGYSKESPPDKIVDCDVTSYIPGSCSVDCDDRCPDKTNPYGCGGWQTLTRQITVPPNDFGVVCPLLVRKRKCNQIKCPVDCVMSRWSGFSACSKDCEGGVQGRTRSIITKPKNGGMSCNTAQESRPCNTGSCDRNCKLKKWSKWSPCSVACSGGFQERWRRVKLPIRGNGRCPKPKSKIRYGIKMCNTFKCKGDEVCIAKQDLVIAIDGSGSLRESGFKILRDFTAGLIDKYMGKYYGFEDMRIGVVQFGNGEVNDAGLVSDAVLVEKLTSDMAKVKASIQGLAFKKGFTNMAQAFTLAEKLFLLGGRKQAMSAVMTLTDGKPSFVFQTYEKVMQLKDKHVTLFFAPVTEFKGQELALMKKWASDPWETNLVRIPGLAPLKADSDLFAQKILVKFCPESMSPSSMMVEEQDMGYMLVAENMHCGTRGQSLSTKVAGVADCAALAQGAGVKAFSLGTHYARGRCYAESLDVTADTISEINKNRVNPPCPGGEWESDSLFDFYILTPSTHQTAL